MIFNNRRLLTDRILVDSVIGSHWRLADGLRVESCRLALSTQRSHKPPMLGDSDKLPVLGGVKFPVLGAGVKFPVLGAGVKLPVLCGADVPKLVLSRSGQTIHNGGLYMQGLYDAQTHSFA